MIGNDIIDLSDPESSPNACHSRFDRRVFSVDEFEALSSDYSEVQRRWILWSAKEAAYKAARRVSADVSFSPLCFVVDLDRALCGSVQHEGYSWMVRVEVERDCVHAVVGQADAFPEIISATRRLTTSELCDPSAGVRRFAIESIAEALGVARSDLQIESMGRIPQLIWVGPDVRASISLSHHGWFVGFACLDPRSDRIKATPHLHQSLDSKNAKSSQSPWESPADRGYAPVLREDGFS